VVFAELAGESREYARTGNADTGFIQIMK